MCRFNFSARSPAPEKWNSLRHGVTPPAHPAPSRWFDSRVRVDMVRVHLGLSGVLKMIILVFLGHPWCPFLGLGVALGVHFEGLGVPLGAFGAQSSPRTASLS